MAKKVYIDFELRYKEAVANLDEMQKEYTKLEKKVEKYDDAVQETSESTKEMGGDLDSVTGHPKWETALFNLYNQIFGQDGQLIVSANASPRLCSIELADLQCRMMKLPVFQIKTLDENLRISALQLRSNHRGIELPVSTAKYLLKRSRRDMTSLYKILDQLDKEGLRAKRRLTIPFARKVLSSIKY